MSTQPHHDSPEPTRASAGERVVQGHGFAPGPQEANSPFELPEERKVTVCDKCLQASCWQGIFMCQEAQYAGITEKTVAELRKLGLENPDYWKP